MKEIKEEKVEPKFHKGDWIIHHGTENIYQVVAIIDNHYQLKYGDNYTVQKCDDVDRCARLCITKENKELLLVDLCARVPYGVMCSIKGHEKKYLYSNFKKYITNSIDKPVRITGISIDKDCIELDSLGISEVYGSDDFGGLKPYLRPMSSMTEEERAEFSKLLDKRYCEEDWEGHISTSYCIEIDNVYTDDEGGIKYPSVFRMDAIDWMNKHHFDYRGLIEKGLALEAPEGMYK